MKLQIWAGIGLFSVGWLLTAAAPANDLPTPVSLVSNSLEMSSLMNELNDLRAEVDELKACNAGGGKTLPHGCDCCYPSGWFAGAEAVVVKPHFGNGVFKEPGYPSVPDFDYYVSPRVFVGVRGAHGLGLRARYWYFDQAADPVSMMVNNFLLVAPAPTIEVASGLRVDALDLEATKAFFLCGTHWDLAAGLRYGKVETGTSSSTTALPIDSDVLQTSIAQFNADFEGIGPTFSLEGRHQIGCSRLAVVGNLRASLLYGDQKLRQQSFFGGDESVVIQGNTASLDDKLVPVLESQVGLEWTTPVGPGCFSLRCLLEGQWWANSLSPYSGIGRVGLVNGAVPIGFYGGAEDLGFLGGTISAAYAW